MAVVKFVQWLCFVRQPPPTAQLFTIPAARPTGGHCHDSHSRARRRLERTSAIASSPIWRNACQGVGVDGHVGWGLLELMWLRLAGRSERSAGSRRWSCSYSGAGYPKTLFVARPLSMVERGAGDCGEAPGVWRRRRLPWVERKARILPEPTRDVPRPEPGRATLMQTATTRPSI